MEKTMSEVSVCTKAKEQKGMYFLAMSAQEFVGNKKIMAHLRKAVDARIADLKKTKQAMTASDAKEVLFGFVELQDILRRFAKAVKVEQFAFARKALDNFISQLKEKIIDGTEEKGKTAKDILSTVEEKAKIGAEKLKSFVEHGVESIKKNILEKD